MKTESRQERVVVGFTPASGTRRGLGALLLGVNEGGALRYAGKGFDEATLDALARRLAGATVTQAPVIDPPRMHEAGWVEPELVAEVRFSERTRDGRLRHPVFLGLRTDKRPSDVVRERAK